MNLRPCRAALAPFRPGTCRLKSRFTHMPSDSKAPNGENFFNFKACEGSVPGSTPIEDKAENEEIVML